MKFLLKCVACCRSAAAKSAQPRVEEATSLALPSPPPQSPRSDSGHYQSRKRGRAMALRLRSVADWRPSLRLISEDIVAPEWRKANLAETERTVKRKVGHTTTAIAHVRSRSDDFGYVNVSFTSAIPVFRFVG
ncbi:hypothetical protein U1Q18_024127 [Sarracenia purpurea var. burkii]